MHGTSQLDFSMTFLVADDHPFVCDALARLIAFYAPLSTTLQAHSLDEISQHAKQVQHIDGFCLDYLMPGLASIENLLLFRRSYPTSTILIVSAVEDKTLPAQLIAAGADAFLPKSLASTQFAQKLVDNLSRRNTSEPTPASNTPAHILPAEKKLGALTRRETEILNQLCSGHSNKVISQKLGLAEPTIKMHLSHIYQKLRVKSRAEAIARTHRSYG